jgi:DNA polymerase III subunit delta'
LLAELDRHPNARAVLESALAPGATPSHAYLFHGPGGAGKREIARAAAAQWLSDGAADPVSAHARALAGAHPDLTWVAPSGAHEILVSDIAEPVVAAASRTPFESKKRVFVIEQADELGDDAANRLLKTLEEPASFVHLILITNRLPDVLPTIRSRCQVVRFDAPSAEQVAAELHAAGVEPQTAMAYARLSFGDAGVARELAAAEGVELRARSQEFVERVLSDERGGAAPWQGLLEAVKARGERLRIELEQRSAAELELYPKKERKRVETEWGDRIKRGRRRVETGALDLGLSLIAAWLLDLAALAWGAEDLVRNVDRREQLARDARLRPGLGGARLTQAVELVEDTRARLQLNVSEDLACEALAFRLQRALGG